MADQFLSNDDYELLRRQKCANMSDDQFAVFRHAIERFRLDPFASQIYATVRTSRGKESVVIQTGIDGYRLIADRTGLYAGNDDPVFDNENKPTKATVSVYKIVGGQRCPFTATARWDQYFPGEAQGMMWKRMPHLMLGKCSEALALRKAFPAELAGLYTTEEMQQANLDQPVKADTPETACDTTASKSANGAGKEEACNKALAAATTINRVTDLVAAARERIKDAAAIERIEKKAGNKIAALLAEIAKTEDTADVLTTWGQFIPTCELLTPLQQEVAMGALLAREAELAEKFEEAAAPA